MTETVEWAAWTTWRGSPRLVRHVADTAIRAVGVAPEHVSLSASVLDDTEIFDTPSNFVEDITPEALRQFDRLDIQVRDELISISIVFLRRGEDSSLLGPDGSKAQMTVRSTDPSRSAEAVARDVCASMRRGHRRWLGQTSGSDGLPVTSRGRSLPRPAAVSAGARLLGGFVLAGVVLSTTTTLFPALELSSAVSSVVAAVAGVGSAFVIAALVPSIEIAEPGETRLSQTARWIATTLIGLVVAQLLKRAFGD